MIYNNRTYNMNYNIRAYNMNHSKNINIPAYIQLLFYRNSLAISMLKDNSNRMSNFIY